VNGFAGSDPAGIAATWVAAATTVAVWSYFVGARRIFRVAQYLLAGLATGYLVLLAVREVLVPQLVVPLAANPGGEPVLWLGAVLAGALVVGRWLPPVAAAIPISLLVAATAAFALGGAVAGTLLPQLAAAVVPSPSPPWSCSASCTVCVGAGSPGRQPAPGAGCCSAALVAGWASCW
jgi:hypothetical protein